MPPNYTLNNSIIKYLIGKTINDSKYNKILKDIIIQTKQISNMDSQIDIIYNICTLITYALYTDLLRKLFAKNHVSDSMIRNLLLCINDRQDTSTINQSQIKNDLKDHGKQEIVNKENTASTAHPEYIIVPAKPPVNIFELPKKLPKEDTSGTI